MPPDRTLNPLYYLANFRRALDWIEARYRDVLGDDEHQFLAVFRALPEPSQALLVRMLMRKGPHFRTNRLAYDEIGCPLAAARELIAAGWIDDDPLLAHDELFPLVSKAELQQTVSTVSAAAGQIRGARKIDLYVTLTTLEPEPRSWCQWLPSDASRVFHLRIAPAVDRFRLMFFGNLYQDWSEFVVADLGIVRYESVAFPDSARAFQTRGDVDVYLTLQGCRDALERFDASNEENEPAPLAALLTAVEDCTTPNLWLEARRARLLYAIGQALERSSRWHDALNVYSCSQHPGARFRQVRVLEALERFDEALALAAQIVAEPLDDEEHQQGERTLQRLQRKLGQRMARRHAKRPIVQEDVTLPQPTPPERVEHAALHHLTCEDAPVFYVENGLINSLFGLLCWRAIFAPVQGAFFNPFQRGPADLSAHDFHARRTAWFDACFEALDSGTYRQSILDTYAQKHGIASPFVAWKMLTPELLQLALDCLPAAHLKLWFRRLLLDVRANRSGLPDLIRFWPAQQRYELIEIKGPGDRLQDNQVRWLDYCVLHDLPVRVLHVRWLNAAADEQDEQDVQDAQLAARNLA